jgi:hypothetical protein
MSRHPRRRCQWLGTHPARWAVKSEACGRKGAHRRGITNVVRKLFEREDDPLVRIFQLRRDTKETVVSELASDLTPESRSAGLVRDCQSDVMLRNQG